MQPKIDSSDETRTAEKPTVSIVIPSYNHRLYVEQAVESAVGQSDDGFSLEVLVVDDGSTDGSAQWLQAHPNLESTTPLPYSVGGYAGLVIDFELGTPAETLDALGEIATLDTPRASLGLIPGAITDPLQAAPTLQQSPQATHQRIVKRFRMS